MNFLDPLGTVRCIGNTAMTKTDTCCSYDVHSLAEGRWQKQIKTGKCNFRLWQVLWGNKAELCAKESLTLLLFKLKWCLWGGDIWAKIWIIKSSESHMKSWRESSLGKGNSKVKGTRWPKTWQCSWDRKTSMPRTASEWQCG